MIYNARQAFDTITIAAFILRVAVATTRSGRRLDDLRDALSKGCSVATIPTGLVLVGSALFPPLAALVDGLGLYLALAGVVVVWLGIQDLLT